MEKFLIVKTSAIGDVIQCFPIIEYLKKRFTKCTIDWVVERQTAPLLHAHPKIDQVIEIDSKVWRKNIFKNFPSILSFCKVLRKNNYDAVFDLQGNFKSALVTIFAKANRKVGYDWKSVPERLNYFATNVHLSPGSVINVRLANLKIVQDYFGDDDPIDLSPIEFKLNGAEQDKFNLYSPFFSHNFKCMVCFGSNWQNKRLNETTLGNFLKLIEKNYSPFFFFVYGNEKEKQICHTLQNTFPQSKCIGDMSLSLWQNLMQKMDLVISMDSAALHLCSTTSTPSFSFFGPSSAEAYKPLGDHHSAFQGRCPYQITFTKRCPLLRTCPTGSCLQDRGGDECFQEFQMFWDSRNREFSIR